ncbi:MAG: helix-turn-helix domain-containing protein [Deltaproteobacteria bacterium]|nr:helix-turn-helix domain-containing protein [Deltaproteobacteria bacterium]
MDFGNDFAARLRRRREELGFTQEGLAQKVSLSKATIQKYEGGQIPKGLHLAALSRVLEITTDYLLFGEGPMQRDLLVRSVAQEAALSRAAERPTQPPSVNDAPSELVIPQIGTVDPACFDLVPLAEAELSAGGGAFVLSEADGAPHAFRKDWLNRVATSPNNVVLLQIKGDSMEPTIIDGDIVLMDKGRQRIVDGYIFGLGVDETVMIKRLYLLPNGRIQIKSDSPSFDPFEMERGEMRVLGQIIWRAGRPRPTPPRRP